MAESRKQAPDAASASLMAQLDVLVAMAREEEDEANHAEQASLPTLTVSNTDPRLLSFLAALSEERAAAFALADWLHEQGDPRAAPVRELAETLVVVPGGGPVRHHDRPMVASPSYCVVRRARTVTARAYPDTLLGSLLRAGEYGTVVAVHVPRNHQTPERLLAACERCRRSLILALFGTSLQLLRARQVLLHERRMNRVTRTLARCGPQVIPMLLEMGEADHARFQEIFLAIWTVPGLHALGYRLMDIVSPNWRRRIPSILTGGSGVGKA